MENIFKKKLQEEIQKFILLSNYNTKKTLTENELDDDPFGDLDTNTIPGTLRGDSENKSGKLNFSGVIDGTSTYGIFKNKGYIPSLSKKDIIGIRSASSAVKKGIVIPKTEPQTQPKKSTEVKNIDIEISIEGDILRIAHDKDGNIEDLSRDYIYRGISKRSFNLAYRISTKFDITKAEATMENGLLKIEIPVATETKTKLLTIK